MIHFVKKCLRFPPTNSYFDTERQKVHIICNNLSFDYVYLSQHLALIVQECRRSEVESYGFVFPNNHFDSQEYRNFHNNDF